MIRFGTFVALLFVVSATPISLYGQDKPAANQSTDQDEKSLLWREFDEKKFDQQRFGRPIIIAFMRDLCPGCKAKRDALWSDEKVVKEVLARNIYLFSGNAQTNKDLAEVVKKRFNVSAFPVVILIGKSMNDKPVLIAGIPEPDQVIKALQKELPKKELPKKNLPKATSK